MKCPKCGYLGFDAGDRCRNCGYDFSLALDRVEPQDQPLRTGAEPHGPLEDFDLTDQRRSPPRPALSTLDLDRVLGESPGPTADLPLFADAAPDEAPLVSAAAPRPPLAVRRATPDTPRLRDRPSRVEAPTLDLEPPRADARAVGKAAKPQAHEATAPEVAGAGRRFGAALLDLLILAAIDGAVLYFTLRLCQLSAAEIGILPALPFAAFLALLNGGYLVVFTSVGGQTIGKMATGVKVETIDGKPLDAGRATLRVAGSVVSLLTAGLGYLPALVGESRRALHDRIAATHVIRAPEA